MQQRTVLLSFVMAALSVGLAASWLSLLSSSPIRPLPGAFPPRPKEEGVFAHNALLHGVEKIGVGELPGPEDLALDSHGGIIYTGCADGWIRRIEADGRVVKWAFVGGRPLGLVVGLHGELLVCDAFQGLLNVTEGSVEVLSAEADGVKYKFANGLDVANDGTIYFTDASQRFDIDHFVLDVLECRPNGRLLKYDPSTRKTTLLAKDLYLPNGVALSEHQDFLVFCETNMARCRKYWLAGGKKGSIENFIDSLPGYPDNIRSNKNGKFYLALVSSRTWFSEEIMLKYSFIKHILAHPKLIPAVTENMPKTSRILVLSEEGKPVALYEDPDGKEVWSVSSGLEVGEYLYIGTLYSNYISRLKLI